MANTIGSKVMISYAQNFEDVMLMRALSSIQRGYYIDVGAAWPDQHSVTKVFYENGWSGINIEPNSSFLELLQCRRPRHHNIGEAAGREPGSLSINFFEETGLSTLVDSIAETNSTNGFVADRQVVSVTTLSIIWEKYIPKNQDVHFLKVDVEGYEESVLEGNDWAKNRPWIVLVEATLPLSQTESYASWEPILLHSNYCFAYADGLNRFYVAREHDYLLPAFKYPPNVFDEFKLCTQADAENELVVAQKQIEVIQAQLRMFERLQMEAIESIRRDAVITERRELEILEIIKASEAELALWKRKVLETEREFSQKFEMRHALLERRALKAKNKLAKKFEIRVALLEQRAKYAEAEISRFRASLSWRITYPLRKMFDFLKAILIFIRKIINSLVSRIIDRFQKPISKLIHVVLGSSALSGWLNGLILKYPPLHQHLVAVAMRQGVIPSKPFALPELARSNTNKFLNYRARKIYDDLCGLRQQ